MGLQQNGTGKRELRAADANYKPRSKWAILYGLLLVTFYFMAAPIYHIANLFLKKEKSLKDKVCIVTGSGRGLGRRLAMKLAKLGARVACVDIHSTNNLETVKMIHEEDGIATAYTANVSNLEEVTALVGKVSTEMGPIYLLLNNAALVMGLTHEEWTPREIQASFNVNVLGNYWTNMKVLEGMKQRNEGHIVTIASLSALVPIPCLTVYAATKAAVSSMSEGLRQELDLVPGNNIKVTTVYPFFINTSADYMSYFDIKLPVLSEEEACNIIIEAIKYEEVSISVPKVYFNFALIARMLPDQVQKKLRELFTIGMAPPKITERKNLPYFDVVNSSSSIIEKGK